MSYIVSVDKAYSAGSVCNASHRNDFYEEYYDAYGEYKEEVTSAAETLTKVKRGIRNVNYDRINISLFDCDESEFLAQIELDFC